MNNKDAKLELNKVIGTRIRQSREIANMTQEKLADLINVTVQYVSDLERGKVGASLYTLSNICSALNVSADYLLFGKREPNDISNIIYRLEALSPNQLKVVEDGVNVIISAMSIPKSRN